MVYWAAPNNAQNIVSGPFDYNQYIKRVSNTPSNQNERTKRDSDKEAEMCPSLLKL